jgi:hypothetical protein
MTAPYEDRHCVIPAARALRPAADVHFRIVCLHQGPEAADCDTDRSYEQRQMRPRVSARTSHAPFRRSRRQAAQGVWRKNPGLVVKNLAVMSAVGPAPQGCLHPECGWRRCGPFRPPPSEGNEPLAVILTVATSRERRRCPAATASRLGLDQFVLSSSVGGDHMTDRAAEARACGRGTR